MKRNKPRKRGPHGSVRPYIPPHKSDWYLAVPYKVTRGARKITPMAIGLELPVNVKQGASWPWAYTFNLRTGVPGGALAFVSLWGRVDSVVEAASRDSRSAGNDWLVYHVAARCTLGSRCPRTDDPKWVSDTANVTVTFHNDRACLKVLEQDIEWKLIRRFSV